MDSILRSHKCEDLIRPLVLEILSPISGKWIITEANVDSRQIDTILKSANSSWAEIVPSHQNDTGVFNQGDMM
ncbi:hypothetical protein AAFF_G00408940 [Aldrovandia affinis]|uniref:Uncharacterized protein n=1 Tax=Aldrovandia affinis TaxID=143900 RepID=A0AAD7SBY1_9TELE|nr:hypothetical protein AAFF_G00408940 [Aldrovandia affinis]